MASRSRSYKISADLDDVAELLAQENGYPSGAALIKGLIRYAALTRGKHKVTLPWSLLPLPDQDKIDSALLRRVKDGKGMTAAAAAQIDWKDL